MLRLAAVPLTLGVSLGATAQMTSNRLHLAAVTFVGLSLGIFATIAVSKVGEWGFKVVEKRKNEHVQSALGYAIYFGGVLLQVGIAICAALVSRALVASFGAN